MTVTNQTCRTAVIGSNAAGQAVPFLFPALDNGDIQVYALAVTGISVVFTVASWTLNPAAGSTYTTGGVTYTVISSTATSLTAVAFTATAPSATGTLTRATGTGDATKAYTAIVSTVISNVQTTLIEDTDFTVTLASPGEGGWVVLTAAWPTTTLIVVVRQTPITQELVLENGGLYQAENMNAEYDNLTRIAIENSDALARSIVIPQTDLAGLNLTLPDAVGRQMAYLFFDANGNVTAVTNVITGSTVVANFWLNVLVQATQANSLAALGIPAALQAVITAASTSAALTALGGGTTGVAVFKAANAGIALAALGLPAVPGTVGLAVLGAATATIARAALGVPAADDIECWEGDVQTWQDGVETWTA